MSKCWAVVGRHYLISIVLLLIFTLGSWQYLDYNNIIILLRQASVIGIGVLGASIIALCDGMLLSCGAQIAFTGFFVAILHSMGVPLWLAVICSFALAGLAGAAIGSLAHCSKTPILILSLGFDILLSGCNNIMVQSLGDYPLLGLTWLMNDAFAGLPWSLLLFILCVMLYTVVDHCSTWGRALHAVGENEATACSAGLPTLRLKLAAYVVGFMLINLCGIVMAARVVIPRATIYQENSYIIICVLCMIGMGLHKGIGSFPAILPGTLAVIGIPVIISIHNLTWVSPILVCGAIITIALIYEGYRISKQNMLNQTNLYH